MPALRASRAQGRGHGIALLLALAVGASVAMLGGAAAQTGPTCSVAPTEVHPGEDVVLNVSNAENATEVQFDVDGDGSVDRVDEGNFTVTATYDAAGTYEPVARIVRDDRRDDSTTVDCGVVTVAENRPPRVALRAAPDTAAVGETVTLDAGDSTDADGTIVDYRWDVDGDGSVELDGESETVEHAYTDPGTYRPVVTVVDDDGTTSGANATVTVEPAAPEAACNLSTSTLTAGEALTVDASATTDAEYLTVDLDGDGTPDRRLEDSFVTSETYADPGEVEPTVTAHADAGEDSADCGRLEILASGEQAETDGAQGGGAGGESSGAGDDGPATQGGDGGAGVDGSGAAGGRSGPGSIPHAGGTIVLLGAAGWLLGRAREHTDDPRPRGVFEWRSDLGERVAAGTEAPRPGEELTVDVGFDPDLVLVSAREAVDASGPRRATASGVGLATPDGVVQHAVGTSLGDGADRTATADGAVATILGETENLEVSVTGTHEDGFDLACTASGDDSSADDGGTGAGAAVCYRAVRLPGDVEATVGVHAVAADAESVTLAASRGLDALLLEAVTSGEDGSFPICFGAGTAAVERHEQTAVGWDGADAAAGDGHVLNLGADAARAKARSLAEEPELAYDGPARIDHVLQFVGLRGAPSLAPSTGTVDVEAESGAEVDVGFQPAMVECWIVTGEPSAVEPPAFATAVVDGDDVRCERLDRVEAPTPVPDGARRGVARGSGPDDSTLARLGGGSRADTSVVLERFVEDGFVLAIQRTHRVDARATVAYRAWPGPVEGSDPTDGHRSQSDDGPSGGEKR